MICPFWYLTSSSVPGGQAYEIMKELGTNVQLLPNHTTPQKTDTYFSRKMKTNRFENYVLFFSAKLLIMRSDLFVA